MTSPARSPLASPTWVGRAALRPGAPWRPPVGRAPVPIRPAAARPRAASGPRFANVARRRPELAAALLLAALWIGLWAVFTAGVVLPGAGVHASGATPPAASG